MVYTVSMTNKEQEAITRASALADLRSLVADAEQARDGDSNDDEIDALWVALETALSLVPGYETPQDV